ncbi:MAG: hypothetical protein H0T62_14415, partial [Parachlamydiaceae bacterium]|nr:hypothetical protein [Parachlamydiaceae bacterium]
SFHRQRWALFIETHGSQLDQAVKIAEFFTQNQANYKTDLRSHNHQTKLVVQACFDFLKFYRENRENLLTDISNVLGSHLDVDREDTSIEFGEVKTEYSETQKSEVVLETGLKDLNQNIAQTQLRSKRGAVADDEEIK